MSSIPPDPTLSGGLPAPGGPTGLDLFFDRLRRLGVARASHGKMAGGVCAGLARRWGVDPIVVRAVVVVLMVFGGLGLLAYLVALALLPDENGRIFTEEALRRGDGSAIFLLVVIGIMLAGELSDRWWVWAAIPLALAAWWVVRGAAAGKTPRQLGSEAKDRATGAASTVRSWTTSSTVASTPPPAPPTAGSPWAALPQDRPADAPPSASPAPPPAAPPTASIPTPSTPPSGPHGMGPGRTWAPAAQGPVAVVVRTKRRCGGFPLFVTAIGLGVATFGMLSSLDGLSSRVDQPTVFAAVAGCAVAALVMFIAALRGRRAPLTNVVVTTALIVSAIAAFVPTPTTFLAGAGERHWRPVASSTATNPPYTLGLGQATLDLGGISSDADAYPITVTLGLGELLIIVPDGITARVDLTLSGGEVSTEQATGERRPTGVTSGSDITESYLVGSGAPDVVITASVVAGAVVLRSTAVPVIVGGSS
ncbi:MAG: PspC domain-containing protein [Actinomycetales bacterium]|nr:PspC domain-containing protein [Candidatus Phosphoribacter baldrii]